MKLKIKQGKVGEAEAWCLKHIGPRMFYLHHKIGGVGWVLKKEHSGWELELDNKDKNYLFLLMKFSDQ